MNNISINHLFITCSKGNSLTIQNIRQKFNKELHSFSLIERCIGTSSLAFSCDV